MKRENNENVAVPKILIQNSENVDSERKIHNKSKLGADFVPPDGGWGWLVVLAAGCSNLCTFAVLQQFGLIFRDRLTSMGLSNTQITTIINMNPCVTSCMGLLNGPMFRRFSYRQVACFGACLVALGLYLASIGNSFASFIITFSVIYGAGMGINASANSLALNTYFKEKRRTATGLSWTATGLGPIFMPYIVNGLLDSFGFQGTLLLFSGLAMHAIACSLLYQPVQWHVKTLPNETSSEDPFKEAEYKCKFCRLHSRKSRSLFSSQYLYNADDWSATGYEIIDPGIPMMSEANDGYFTPKRSLHNSKLSLVGKIDSLRTSSQNLAASRRPSYANTLNSNTERREKKKSTAIRIDEHPTEDCPSYKAPQDMSSDHSSNLQNSNLVDKKYTEDKYLLDNHSCTSYKHSHKLKRSNTFNTEQEVLKVASEKLEEFADNKNNDSKPLKLKCTCVEDKQLILTAMQASNNDNGDDDDHSENPKSRSLLQKFTVFFDLDLLKDLTYVNLMVGITVANFAELNFSILTPFVLKDFGFTQGQIALAMSLLGAMDISVRFFIPFVAGKIGWQNNTFFLFGVLGMALGRIVLAHFRSYSVVLVAAAWIGLNKGLRTIFMALVIPSYVTLDRLPAASGLQLAFAGIFFFLMGPVVGWVRDTTDYTITLHFLNFATYFTAICWGLEKFYRNRKGANNSQLD